MIDENKLNEVLESICKSGLSNGIGIVRDEGLELSLLKRKYRSFFNELERCLKSYTSFNGIIIKDFFTLFSNKAYMRISLTPDKRIMDINFGNKAIYLGKWSKVVTLEEFIFMVTTNITYADE